METPELQETAPDPNYMRAQQELARLLQNAQVPARLFMVFAIFYLTACGDFISPVSDAGATSLPPENPPGLDPEDPHEHQTPTTTPTTSVSSPANPLNGTPWNHSPTPTPLPPTPIETPTSVPETPATQLPENQDPYEGSLAQHLHYIHNEAGQLVGFELDGINYYLDMPEVIHARESAMQTGFPQVVAIAPRSSDTAPPPSSPEHPYFDEVPTDALSAEELRQKGITILQDSENPILFIGESAMREGGLLEYFNGSPDNTDTLTIVPLAGSSYLTPKALPEDLRQEFAAQLPEEIDPLHAIDPQRYLETAVSTVEIEYIAPLRRELLQLRKDIATGAVEDNLDSQAKITNLLANIARYSAEIEHLKKKQDDPDYLAHFIAYHSQGTQLRLGGYINKPREDSVDHYIFLAAGEGIPPRREVVLYFTPEGNLTAGDFLYAYERSQRVPHESQSFPNPADYYRDLESMSANASGYLSREDVLFILLRHELQHLRNWLIAQELIEPQNDVEANAAAQLSLGAAMPLADHEHLTDIATLMRLQEASQAWRERGDDQGFHFYLRTSSGHFIQVGNPSSQPIVQAPGSSPKVPTFHHKQKRIRNTTT